MISANDIEEKWISVLGEKNGKLALFWNSNMWKWLSKEDLYRTMKTWRTSAKDGTLKINLCNNKELEDIRNKTWFVLVVQLYDRESLQYENEHCTDLGAFHILDYTTSGTVYMFRNKENRDSIYTYVMKDVGEDSF